LKDYLLTGKCIFKDVWINYHIIDEQGKKMSKSAGNGIDPKDVLDRFGAEPFRMWAALEGNLEKTDFRCSMERIEGSAKTISKLWNVAKFISMFPKLDGADARNIEQHLTELDKWILDQANILVIKANQCYERYDFHNPAVEIRHFIWEVFASNYLELVKNRAYNQSNDFTKQQQDAAIYSLNHVLDIILGLLAPILPLLTFKIFDALHGKDIHFEQFPKPTKIFEPNLTTEDISELNSYIWKAKRDKSKSLKEEVSRLIIEEKYKPIQHDIISAHNIKHLSFGERLIEL
jgi:valyl-tRNA synthetase